MDIQANGGLANRHCGVRKSKSYSMHPCFRSKLSYTFALFFSSLAPWSLLVVQKRRNHYQRYSEGIRIQLGYRAHSPDGATA